MSASVTSALGRLISRPEHLEGGAVGDFAVVGLAGGVDRRVRDRTQLLLLDGLAQGAADQVGEHLATHLLAETLLDHRGRHLARAEALQAHGTAHLRDALADLGIEALGRKLHGELALELADVFNRNLHDVSEWLVFVGHQAPLSKVKMQPRGGPILAFTDERTNKPMVRKEGLEPSRGYPLEPKSSASTNSATFALAPPLPGPARAARRHEPQTGIPRRETGHFMVPSQLCTSTGRGKKKTGAQVSPSACFYWWAV